VTNGMRARELMPHRDASRSDRRFCRTTSRQSRVADRRLGLRPRRRVSPNKRPHRRGALTPRCRQGATCTHSVDPQALPNAGGGHRTLGKAPAVVGAVDRASPRGSSGRQAGGLTDPAPKAIHMCARCAPSVNSREPTAANSNRLGRRLSTVSGPEGPTRTHQTF